MPLAPIGGGGIKTPLMEYFAIDNIFILLKGIYNEIWSKKQVYAQFYCLVHIDSQIKK